jgi:hypothetical protein
MYGSEVMEMAEDKKKIFYDEVLAMVVIEHTLRNGHRYLTVEPIIADRDEFARMAVDAGDVFSDNGRVVGTLPMRRSAYAVEGVVDDEGTLKPLGYDFPSVRSEMGPDDWEGLRLEAIEREKTRVAQAKP